MDDGDLSVPLCLPARDVEEEMYHEYYKGIHGVESKLADVQK